MLKDKIRTIIHYIAKHSKIVFPIIVIAAVALTVSLALNATKSDDLPTELLESTLEEIVAEETAVPEVDDEVPMVPNGDEGIRTLILTFYNAMALGDEAAMYSVCDEIEIADMLGYLERANYIETYPVIEIYTKPGPEEGSTIAFIYYKVVFAGHEEEFPGYTAHYICTNEQGEYYIKKGQNTDEVNEYIGRLMSQDDVVEFNNRVTVEYNELMLEHPELLEYLNEMNSQVSAAVGIKLADLNAQNEAESGAAEGEAAGETTTEDPATATGGENATENTETTPAEPVVENVVQYATATTTVNVRSSDSEQADKLGKVTEGTKLQILEQKVNGWTKVKYEGKEGYIKSEFLELAESAAGLTSIGTVTATTNINVRASASQSADKLGVLVGGETVDLYATENGWCKINYNGQIGYVKADYVE